MGTPTNFAEQCAARVAGYKISNVDIDRGANIDISKFATFTKKMNLPLFGAYKEDAQTSELASVFPSMDFDGVAGSQEAIRWGFVIPADWASGAITLKIAWIGTAGGGNVVWDANSYFASDSTANNVAATASISATDANAATMTVTSIGSIGTPSAGQLCSLKLYRDADDANDTADNIDVNLVAAWLEYTAQG